MQRNRFFTRSCVSSPSRFQSTVDLGSSGYLRLLVGLICLVGFAASGALLAAAPPSGEPVAGDSRAATETVMPLYDEENKLLLPADFRRWVFAGSSLGLSYSPSPGSHEMFHHTLIEPSAYDHFVETGEFREGTMLALLLHGIGEGAAPSRRGRFAAEIHAVELAVKDSNRVEEGWAYYNFGVPEGLRPSAEPFPRQACHDCHLEHAARDNVFLQFYPLLADAEKGQAPTHAGSRSGSEDRGEREEMEPAGGDEDETPALALRGLDPVLLAEGREELGKPELVVTFGDYRYQFVSEPTRARFDVDRERYAIQNDTCLVVPGAPPSPDLFAVHQGHIYIFATPGCVEDFKADPEAYVDASE